MTVIDKLKHIEYEIQAVQKTIRKCPDLLAVTQLIDACSNLELDYKDFCEQHDKELGEPVGTAYAHGVSIEFYIEALDWHDVSMALRQLKKGESL